MRHSEKFALKKILLIFTQDSDAAQNLCAHFLFAVNMLLSTNSAMSQIPVVEILWGGFGFGLRRTTRPVQ